MKIAISGSTGLIGRALVQALKIDGHNILPIVRTAATTSDEIFWDTENHTIEGDKLAGIEAVIHLAGENIAADRWTEESKARIRDSRVEGTGTIASALAGLSQPPSVFLVASALGYYGDRGDEILDESAGPGDGFLADVTAAWEQAAQRAVDHGIRTVQLRIGVVLSPDGGALPKMVKPFKLGVGGRLGTGKQYMSWVSLTDVVRAFQHALTDESLSGPVNLVSPTPISNADFTDALGDSLSRPTVARVPAFALKMMAGEMAEELLLASFRVVPAKLQAAGFEFQDVNLDETLQKLLKESD